MINVQDVGINILGKTTVYLIGLAPFVTVFRTQKELLATPFCRIRKDKKAGLLVSPKDVTVISTVEPEPTFQTPSGQSAQPPTHPTHPTPIASSSASSQPSGFVTAEQFTALSDKWSEQFARMEALLSHGNIFSTPVSAIKPVDSQHFISEIPFLAPATRPTGPVKVPVAVDAPVKVASEEHKTKKKVISHEKMNQVTKLVVVVTDILKRKMTLKPTRSVTGLGHRHQRNLL